MIETYTHEHRHAHEHHSGGGKPHHSNWPMEHPHVHAHGHDQDLNWHPHAHSYKAMESWILIEDSTGLEGKPVEMALVPGASTRFPRPTVAVEPSWIEMAPMRPLLGDEDFLGGPFQVLDFWRWAYADFRENTIRPLVAEFLVAKALGDVRPNRREWADYDIETPEGIKVEVKSSGYCQSWRQRRLSVPVFGRFLGVPLDESGGSYKGEQQLRADVYVFAVQSCRDCLQYDPLDLSQWLFWTVSRARIAAHPGKQVGMSFLDTHAKPIAWAQLRAEVLNVYQETETL